MAVHNNREELPLVLDCLRNQQLADFEVIAVDDGSTDGSGELLDAFARHDGRARIIHQDNTGLGPALHRAATEARGRYFARQDADDVSAPTRLQRQVAYLERHPDVVFCGTWTWFVDPLRGTMSALEVPADHDRLLAYLETGDNPFVHGSVMIRGDRYRAEGIGYRLRRYCEEYDLWLRLTAFGRLGMVESPEYIYRLSPAGMSFGNISSRKPLHDLCLKLHEERKVEGREITNWRAAEAGILSTLQNEQDSHQRNAAATYSHGLQRLDAGDWRGYLESMRSARVVHGPLGRRALGHVMTGFLWPLTRQLYRLRVARTSRRYLRPLKPGTELPSYARGMM
jgi:glycosyltransferase involved in cell wall biosynthesis